MTDFFFFAVAFVAAGLAFPVERTPFAFADLSTVFAFGVAFLTEAFALVFVVFVVFFVVVVIVSTFQTLPHLEAIRIGA